MNESRGMVRAPGMILILASYSLLGMLAGGAEVVVRILASGTPSVMRRAPGLVLTAALLYGIAACGPGVLHFLIQAARKSSNAPAFQLDLALPAPARRARSSPSSHGG